MPKLKISLNADGLIKSFIGGAYLRPNSVELTLYDDDDYIKEIIGLFYRNVIDDAGNVLDPIRYQLFFHLNLNQVKSWV